MALSNELAEAGSAPTRLETTVTIAFEPGEGVLSSDIAGRGAVPGIEQARFAEAAMAASHGCPISAALKETSRSRSTPLES
jgi:lipoyl-dependent peroxiredoxin